MVKIFSFFLLLSLVNKFSYAQKRSNGAVANKPNPCNCNKVSTSTNMWIEGSNKTNFTNYVLEIQSAQVSISTPSSIKPCTATIDSLFFWTTIGNVIDNRFYALTEFTLLEDKLAQDKKWRTLRYRIPKTLFYTPPTLNQPFGIYYNVKIGSANCKPFNDFKITEELL